MADQSNPKAHIWLFSGLIIFAIAAVFAAIIIFGCTAMLLFSQTSTGLQDIYSDDFSYEDEDPHRAEFVEKYPPLEAWYSFADAVMWHDMEAALSAVCDGPVHGRPNPRTFDINDLDLSNLMELLGNFDKTHEVILLRAGFTPEFGFVFENSPDYFNILGTWQLKSLNSLSYYYKEIQPKPTADEAVMQRLDQLKKAIEKTKEPQHFEFYKIKDQWYYLPQGW